MPRIARACAIGLVALAGCGGGAWIVKKPVAEQCSSAGLQKCEDLTDGLVQYVEGDKAGAEPKLRAAAKANSPEKIRAFTDALKPITSVLGSEQQASIDGIIAILAGDGAEPAAQPEPKALARAPESAVETAAAATEAHRPDLVRTGMAKPATDPRATACETGPLGGDESRCRRVRAIVGPFTVTNLYASGGCPDEVFAFAGRAENPHWFIGALPNAPINVNGSFAVEDGEALFVGVRATGKDPPKADSKCTIVWSGVRLE
ncbi:MAG: hypothetical protein KF795_01375 [Labilithrix sp.]|nr:hypothetical protein [Labilithrix sp.]